MPRHAKAVDRRQRAIRTWTVGAIWLCGLAAGFVAILAAAARYGCAPHDAGFACRTSGSVVGIVLVVAVISVIIAVTVLTYDRPARRVLVVGGVGLGGLIVCFALARVLLATV